MNPSYCTVNVLACDAETAEANEQSHFLKILKHQRMSVYVIECIINTGLCWDGTHITGIPYQHQAFAQSIRNATSLLLCFVKSHSSWSHSAMSILVEQ